MLPGKCCACALRVRYECWMWWWLVCHWHTANETERPAYRWIMFWIRNVLDLIQGVAVQMSFFSNGAARHHCPPSLIHVILTVFFILVEVGLLLKTPLCIMQYNSTAPQTTSSSDHKVESTPLSLKVWTKNEHYNHLEGMFIAGLLY